MPERIGRYDAERVLGSGAFATVWLARDEALDAQVAIKVLAENWAHDDDVRRRFAEEARVLWRLDSDRVIRVHAVAELEDGRPYFVMDYADRGSLADRMKTRASEGRQYSIDEALDIGIEIAEALAVVHRLGVVHRDLKPSNVLYRTIGSHHGDTRTERMVLADFGVARALDAATAFTIAAGTPHYMAPEQSEGRADERSDVYAAGVVLYELLAGRVPYPYESVGAVMRAQLTETPAPISSIRDDAPAALDAALARALSAEPEQRYASATEWADALRSVRAVPVESGSAETIIRPVAAAAGAAAGAAAATGPPSAGAAATGPPSPGAAGAGGAATPSAGPPSAGPPSGGPPPGPAAASSSGGGSRRRRNRRLVGAVIVVALIAGVAGVAVLSSGDEATAGEIFLDPRDATRVGNSGPFTAPSIDPSVVVPSTLATNPNAVPPPAPVGGGIPSTSGGEPGLYGGTRDSSVCDPLKLVAFLQENADKAKAWANTLGINVADIQGYVSALTSVLLRADTRVTNHGFASGAATAVQSVLEAGTAVLVDKFGVPRVKCYCGNPLVEPEPVKTSPDYRGPAWPGFEPTVVQVVTPAPQPITVIVVVDVGTGQPFGRPVGTGGGSDVNATLPPRDSTSTTTTKPATTTTTKPAPTTTSGTGNSQTAITLVRDALQRCIDLVSEGGAPSGTADDLGYDATSDGGGVFTVVVSERDGPARGTWRVDTKTGDLTPTDQTASEVGSFCPELA
ncbi:MAG: serine/threonine-protein kinase [Acidimicrobiia bacterium]